MPTRRVAHENRLTTIFKNEIIDDFRKKFYTNSGRGVITELLVDETQIAPGHSLVWIWTLHDLVFRLIESNHWLGILWTTSKECTSTTDVAAAGLCWVVCWVPCNCSAHKQEWLVNPRCIMCLWSEGFLLVGTYTKDTWIFLLQI